MNKLLSFVLFVFISGLIVSCSGHSSEEHYAVSSEEFAAPIKAKEDQKIERKLIKEGWLEFETKSLLSTRNNILEAVNTYNAYVSSDQEFKRTGKVSNTLAIRIPAMYFDDFLNSATEGVERFDVKNINVKDVTEEYLDVEARVKTKKALEERYVSLLEKASNITEILEIEKQIGELRTEIESIEGRLNFLQNQVSYSTLTITFYKKVPYETQFGEKFKNGLRNGWTNLVWFFVFLTNLWPFIVIGVGVFWGIRIYRRRK
ncbi:MAG TPA: DUF4349 domain-containing protein [Brumimicrobium sp.]|nr:DUF4349 domain-containing protein [Brumimicrobium sp.]